jgi:hypothetical protein
VFLKRDSAKYREKYGDFKKIRMKHEKALEVILKSENKDIILFKTIDLLKIIKTTAHHLTDYGEHFTELPVVVILGLEKACFSKKNNDFS